MPEMLSIVQQLLVAGNETTTKLLTETIRLLAENPDQWQQLKDDPSRAPAIVEEALRLSTPTQGMFRIATKDHELEGVQIPKGARIVIVFASANRDAELFGDPDAFDPDRDNLRDHLAFGKGIHFCLGAALSRLEGKVALEEFARRVDRFELDDSNDFEYFPSFLLRGLKRLDVDVDARRERPMSGALDGKIAVVTGSSRGIGRGTAIALGEQGATVYITGRSTGDGELTIDRTAALVDEAGGTGIPVQTDHGNDDEIAALFERVQAPIRASSTSSSTTSTRSRLRRRGAAASGTIPCRSGTTRSASGSARTTWRRGTPPSCCSPPDPVAFICNVSSPGGQSYHFSSSYGAGKAGLDRLGADMAIELEPKGIACRDALPRHGVDRVHRRVVRRARHRHGRRADAARRRSHRSPRWRVPTDLMERSGSIQWVEDLGAEFGLVDEHGRSPAPYHRRRRPTSNRQRSDNARGDTMGKIAGLEVGLPASIDDVDAAWMTEVLRTSGAIGADSSVTSLSNEPFIAGGLLSLLFRSTIESDDAGRADDGDREVPDRHGRATGDGRCVRCLQPRSGLLPRHRAAVRHQHADRSRGDDRRRPLELLHRDGGPRLPPPARPQRWGHLGRGGARDPGTRPLSRRLARLARSCRR